MKSYMYLLLPALLLTACAGMPFQSSTTDDEPTWEEAASNKLIPANYLAADALISQAEQQRVDNHRLDIYQPLVIGTVVNIDSLEESSPLGRMVAEQVSGQFSRRGYKMVELKFRDSVYVRQNVGELTLTREIKELAQNHKAQAVIAGTYTSSKRFIFINLKLIRPNDNIILASYDYAVPVDKMTRSLRKPQQ